MVQKAFRNFYFGFLFVMIDFRVNGFDILPDIVGYIFFVVGLSSLLNMSEHFSKARIFHVIMLIISIFSIYERPAQDGVYISTDFLPGLLIGIAILIIELFAFYHLFMGIKQWANEGGTSHVGIDQWENEGGAINREDTQLNGEGRAPHLASEADHRWKQYLYFQIASFGVFLLIFIPPLAFIYIIAILIVAIVLTVKFMGFMTR
ncbi:MAG: hypothetical protein GX815_12630, partial [Clostridiales bacterium]|nr:hypothetical protein [Clostridiales bacterium]